MGHGRKRRLALAAGMIIVMTLWFGSVTVPAQPRDIAIQSVVPSEVRGALSGVAEFGLPSGITGGPDAGAPGVDSGQARPDHEMGEPAANAPIGIPADVLVSGVNTSAQNEPEIATMKWDNTLRHAAGANDYGTGTGDSRCGGYFSTNGSTWARVAAAGGAIPIPPALAAAPLSLNVAGDPDLAWSNTLIPVSLLTGIPGVYYSCLAFKRVGGGASSGSIYVARSTTGGSSWTALDSGIVATGSSSTFHDKEFIAVDTNTRSPFMGKVYVCWTKFDSTGADILFRHSATQATSWSPAVPGLVLSSTAASSQGCDVAVGPNGVVYVTWLEFTTNLCNGTIRVRRSTNGGVSFFPAVTVAAVAAPDCTIPYRINNFPRIATNRVGNVGIVFSSTLTYGGVASVGLDIWIWRATETLGGAIIVKVNDDRTSGDQFFPTITTSDNSATITTGTGDWYVCFNDRAFLAFPLFNTSCTHSHTNAATWPEPVQVVSDLASNDFQFGGLFIGDYIGVTTSGLGALAPGHRPHPVFQRNSAAGGPDMNIYSVNATHP